MCFFCGREVLGTAHNRHHVIPRRYRQQTAVVDAHIPCHELWHGVYDNPRLSYEEWRIIWEQRDFARNLFTQPS